MFVRPAILERVKKINQQIEIRVAKLDDADDFVSLFNIYYNKKTNKEYFKWQFFDTIYPTKLFVAFEDNKLIGFCGAKIMDLQIQKQQVGYIIDLLISNEYRKKGIPILLIDKIFDYVNSYNVCCLISLPNQYGNNTLNSIGFKTLCKIDSLVLEINDFIKNTKWYQFDQEINSSKKLCINKNQDYLNWRFKHHPNNVYDKIIYNESTFAILKLFKEVNSEKLYLDIMDIFFIDKVGLDVLIDKLLEFSISKSIKNLIIWALPYDFLYTYLTLKGFKLESRERYFCVYKILDIDIEINNIKSWYLSQSDSETF